MLQPSWLHLWHQQSLAPLCTLTMASMQWEWELTVQYLKTLTFQKVSKARTWDDSDCLVGLLNFELEQIIIVPTCIIYTISIPDLCHMNCVTNFAFWVLLQNRPYNVIVTFNLIYGTPNILCVCDQEETIEMASTNIYKKNTGIVFYFFQQKPVCFLDLSQQCKSLKPNEILISWSSLKSKVLGNKWFDSAWQRQVLRSVTLLPWEQEHCWRM